MFDYFSVDGETGCPGEEPENEAPVLGDVTATPTSGFAPLPVAFTAAATDADEDALTYSWDFDGDGDRGLVRAEPVAHLRGGGHVQRQGDGVRRRRRPRSKTVTVTVLPAADAGRALPGARLLQDDGLPARLDRRGHRGDQAARRRPRLPGRRHRGRDGVPRRRALPVRHGGVPVDDGRRRSTTRSRRRSRTSSRPAAATPASTRRRTPSTTWPWYGKLVGAYFRNHPANQDATVRTEHDAHEHAPTEGLPAP